VLVDAIALGDAGESRAHKTGEVTAFSGGLIAATIDDATVTGIHRLAVAYPTPVAGDVALFAVMRGSKGSVQYVAIGKIT
jgi:hypothetical protein